MEKLRIEISYFAISREATNTSHETLFLPKKSTLKTLIELLSEKYPKTLRSYIFDEAGKPLFYLSYFINGKNVHTLYGFDTEIIDGDVVMIVPSILGG